MFSIFRINISSIQKNKSNLKSDFKGLRCSAFCLQIQNGCTSQMYQLLNSKLSACFVVNFEFVGPKQSCICYLQSQTKDIFERNTVLGKILSLCFLLSLKNLNNKPSSSSFELKEDIFERICRVRNNTGDCVYAKR